MITVNDRVQVIKFNPVFAGFIKVHPDTVLGKLGTVLAVDSEPGVRALADVRLDDGRVLPFLMDELAVLHDDDTAPLNVGNL